MPACARKKLLDPRSIQVVHCWARCVRRAFLCGLDPLTGKDYTFRRRQIVRQEKLLARLFAIDIAFHAEMSNHLHLILRNRPDIAATWSAEEVVRRWLSITKLTRNFDHRIVEPSAAEVERQARDPERVATLRLRLSSISHFMAALDENTARRCNRQDGCTGRFWEARFGCRVLVDESAILVCAIYLDLNQVRAGEADSPEQSYHTSVYDRIVAWRQRQGCPLPREPDGTREDDRPDDLESMPADGWLCPLTLEPGPAVDVRSGLGSATPWRASDKGILEMSLEEYLGLVDCAGRQLRSGKKHAIPADLAPILERLHLREATWRDAIEQFERQAGHVVGRACHVAQYAAQAGRRWFRGIRHCARVFR
jgi:hypothetical protein